MLKYGTPVGDHNLTGVNFSRVLGSFINDPESVSTLKIDQSLC